MDQLGADSVEVQMLSKLDKLKHLPTADVELLRNALSVSYGHAERILPSLSIFRQGLPLSKIDIYDYVHIDVPVYYIGIFDGRDGAVFFDGDRKLIHGSRYYLTHLHSFLDHIDTCLSNIRSVDVAKARYLGDGFVCVEKWFYSYGHFKDELYTAANFLQVKAENWRKVILDYPTDDRLDTSTFTHNKNYKEIENLALGHRGQNMYDLGPNAFLLTNVLLVLNGFSSEPFHSFPKAVAEKIKQGAVSGRTSLRKKNIFLTRSASYRDIANKEIVEAHCRAIGYEIINPEYLSYSDLVHALGDADRVIMYYGSAMTNLVYLPEGCRVTILKAASYRDETLALWSKVISQYSLLVDVVDASSANVIEADGIRWSAAG